MAAWRYEISHLVLKKYFTRSMRSLVKYFSTLEEKFRISAQPCNILYVLVSYSGIPVLFYFRTCFIYPVAEFVFIFIVVYWPTFSLIFLIHLFLYSNAYRALKSESERNTLNYSQSDHDFA